MEDFRKLKVRDVRRRLAGDDLFAPTSFTVRPGSCIVVRGPNGVGKTTLLRMVAGQLRPSAGRIELDDRPVDERDARLRRMMATLLHPVAGYPDLTLQDLLVLVDQTWGRPRDGCTERVDDALRQWGIADLRLRFLREMSSGQRQLADLAMTCLRPSRLLVLDEPEQRLDDERRRLLVRVLTELRDSGVGMVLACHDTTVTQAVADEVLPLHAPAT